LLQPAQESIPRQHLHAAGLILHDEEGLRASRAAPASLCCTLDGDACMHGAVQEDWAPLVLGIPVRHELQEVVGGAQPDINLDLKGLRQGRGAAPALLQGALKQRQLRPHVERLAVQRRGVQEVHATPHGRCQRLPGRHRQLLGRRRGAGAAAAAGRGQRFLKGCGGAVGARGEDGQRWRPGPPEAPGLPLWRPTGRPRRKHLLIGGASAAWTVTTSGPPSAAAAASAGAGVD